MVNHGDKVAVVVTKREGEAWSLLNICDPSDFGGSYDKAERRAISLMTSWSAILVDDLVSFGPVPRSEVNHCRSDMTLRSFRGVVR